MRATVVCGQGDKSLYVCTRVCVILIGCESLTSSHFYDVMVNQQRDHQNWLVTGNQQFFFYLVKKKNNGKKNIRKIGMVQPRNSRVVSNCTQGMKQSRNISINTR